MENRISVGVLIFKDDKLLLVKHVDPKTGFVWWVPPGGGVKDAETIFQTAMREVHEETSLSVVPEKLVYVRQIIYRAAARNTLMVYVLADAEAGVLTTKNTKGKGGDEHYIKELKYFSEVEIKTITVFPTMLKDVLWQDRRTNFPEVRFIGVEYDVDQSKSA